MFSTCIMCNDSILCYLSHLEHFSVTSKILKGICETRMSEMRIGSTLHALHTLTTKKTSFMSIQTVRMKSI